MMRNAMALAAVLLSGCPAAETTKDSDTGTVPTCLNLIQDVFPEDGAVDVYYRTSVRFSLVTQDPDATVTVTTADGSPVDGTFTLEENRILWLPAAPLLPNTDYRVTLSYECDDAVIEWTTSDVGVPLEVDVVGLVFDLDLAGGNWVEPPGVGAALASFAKAVEVLVSPTEADAQISFLGGLGTGDDEQDTCSETFVLAGADFQDPYFELETPLLPLQFTGVTINVENLELSGAFAPDGSELAGVVLDGTVDTRPLVPALSPGGADDAICVITGQLGADCEECSDGTGPFCLSLRVENINSPRLAIDPLVPRTQKEIDLDPLCTVQTK